MLNSDLEGRDARLPPLLPGQVTVERVQREKEGKRACDRFHVGTGWQNECYGVFGILNTVWAGLAGDVGVPPMRESMHSMKQNGGHWGMAAVKAEHRQSTDDVSRLLTVLLYAVVRDRGRQGLRRSGASWRVRGWAWRQRS